MKKRIRSVNVEALLKEIARYREQLEADPKRHRPPKRGGRAASQRPDS